MTTPDRDGKHYRKVTSIPIPDGIAPLAFTFAVLGRLVRDHGAQVIEHDVDNAGSLISLSIPVPVQARLRAVESRMSEARIRATHLCDQASSSVEAGRELLRERALLLEEAREKRLRLAIELRETALLRS